MWFVQSGINFFQIITVMLSVLWMLTFFISVVLFLMFYDLYKLHLGFVKYKYSGPFLLSCNTITVADTPPPPQL